MKFTKLDLLTLLISLFIFASCNDNNTIGLDVAPDDAIQGALVDTVTINTKTVADEVTVTYYGPTSETNQNPTRVPFGYLTDPLFGTADAGLALSVNLPTNAYSFGTNAVIDSAVLVLPYATNFYGDTTTSVYSVDVQQLTKDLSIEGSFLSNKEYAANSVIAGKFTGKIKPKTTGRISEIVPGKPDTMKVVPPSLRIKLNNDFVVNNVMNAGAAALLNNATFNSSFKGLKLSVNKTTSSGTGGIMFFNFAASAGARLDIYYKKQNATTATAKDTLAVTFPISQNVNPVAATIKHNYDGTPVAEQLADNSNKQYEVTYLQGLGGLRNKLSFPYLKELTKNIGAKIVINKAELVVDISSGTDVAPLNPAQRLALYQYDIAGKRALIPDQNPNDPVWYRGNGGNFGTGYNIGTKNYTFIVTGLIQNLIDGKTVDNGLYLAPAAPLLAEYGINPSLTTADRSVIGSFINSNHKVKLNIYYTKID